MTDSTLVIEEEKTTVIIQGDDDVLVVDNDIETVIETTSDDTVIEVQEDVQIIETEDEVTVIQNVYEIDTLEIVAQGPQGPPGVNAEEEMVYAKRIDWISDSQFYRGEATPGTLTSVAGWRIRLVTIATDNDVEETWASANASFDKVWDNRAAYSYT